MKTKKSLFLLILFFFVITVSYANNVSEQFFAGMEEFDKENYSKSIKMFKKILKKNPKVSDLGKVQAQIALAYEKMEKYKKAFKAYEEIFKNYPGYEEFETIVEREYFLAEKFNTKTELSWLGIDFSESDKMALDIYQKVVEHLPFGEYGQKAMLETIRLFLKNKNHEQVEKKIDVFYKNYERSEFVEEISYLEALNYHMQMKKSDYDQTKSNTAMEKCTKYIQKYPTGKFIEKVTAMLEEIKNIICENKFNTGKFYLTNNNKDAANKYFNDIINNFPDTSWAKMASDSLIQ
ncbi:MAG: hypothetical protein ACD_79C00426G0002 [uncultured bacterium]|nr:MAG: hypothetical protein ACD_79C00426G0002 [uncultured bacterium]